MGDWMKFGALNDLFSTAQNNFMFRILFATKIILKLNIQSEKFKL